MTSEMYNFIGHITINSLRLLQDEPLSSFVRSVRTSVKYSHNVLHFGSHTMSSCMFSLSLRHSCIVRAKKGILRFNLKNIGSAHFLRIAVTSYQSLQGYTEVIHGKCIEQDVRLFSKKYIPYCTTSA